MKKIDTKILVYTAIFGALGVVLGWISFPVGPTKIYPLQHTINAVAGILIGPWAFISALIAAAVRYATGMGSIYAFPGSPFGALVVAFMYKLTKKDSAALTEPVGTVVIGATISALLIAPFFTQNAPTVWFFWTAFAASCIPGAVLGYGIVKILRRTHVDIHRS